MIETAVEWLAFCGSLASVWLYGRTGYWGPISGVLTAVLFFFFGFMTGTWAAVAANVVFLVLHLRNGMKLMSNDETRIAKRIQEAFSTIQGAAFAASFDAGWWDNTDIKNDPNVVPTKLCLIHSEISEAMEGHRKNLMDDKLPHRKAIEVELADAVIRIGDLAGALGLDVGGAIAEKMAFNRVRPDHKRENRAKAGGKVY